MPSKGITDFCIQHVIVAELTKTTLVSQKKINPEKHFKPIGKIITHRWPQQCITIVQADVRK